MQNLHQLFDWQYIGQIIGGDFAKFCGLRRLGIWTLSGELPVFEYFETNLGNYLSSSINCPTIFPKGSKAVITNPWAFSTESSNLIIVKFVSDPKCTNLGSTSS